MTVGVSKNWLLSIFQFQHPNIVTDGMEAYIELKSTVSDCIIVPLIKGCDQQPAALIE